MKELIETVLDLARCRLNGGIPVSLKMDSRLADELGHVIAEVQSVHCDRMINVDMDIGAPVVCDHRRLGQMLGNLLTNAVIHGDPDVAVSVRVRSDACAFELSITNGASEIIPAMSDGMFQQQDFQVDELAAFLMAQ